MMPVHTLSSFPMSTDTHRTLPYLRFSTYLCCMHGCSDHASSLLDGFAVFHTMKGRLSVCDLITKASQNYEDAACTVGFDRDLLVPEITVPDSLMILMASLRSVPVAESSPFPS